MKRFYFHVRDGDRLFQDTVGSHHPSTEAACAEATAGARDVLERIVHAGGLVSHQGFEICDEAGQVVVVMPFRNALRLS